MQLKSYFNMFLYHMLNKLNYKKSQLNEYFKNKNSIKSPKLNIKWGQKYEFINKIGSFKKRTKLNEK